MLPSGSRSRASRHIHGWLRGPCSNGDAAARQLLDPLVEVVAFEIDGGRRDDLLFGVDLDREGRPARGFEPRIIGRIVDDLLEAEAAVEFDRALVIGAGHRHLVEPRPGADVEPDALPGRSDPRPAPAPARRAARRGRTRAPARPRRPGVAPSARKKAIALASVQPVPCVLVVSIRWPCQLVILSVFDQRVGERVALLVAALDQHRAAMLRRPGGARPRPGLPRWSGA